MKKMLAAVMVMAAISCTLCGCAQSARAAVEGMAAQEETSGTDPGEVLVIRPAKKTEAALSVFPPKETEPAPTEAAKKPAQSQPAASSESAPKKDSQPAKTEKNDAAQTNQNNSSVHIHKYLAAVTAPTCTKKGSTLHTCACGSSYRDSYVDALSHYYTYLPVAPTTTERGYTQVTCQRCGYSYQEDFLAPVEENHVHNYVPTVEAPTCTTGGLTRYRCACGDSYSDNNTAALGHAYEITVVDPTQESQGYTEHTCTRCADTFRDTYTDILPATHTHEYFTQTVDPTCTEQGYTEHFCPCADSYTNSFISALGHAYEITVVDPTQESEGYTEYKCSRCGESFRNTFTDKLPVQHVHSFTEEEKRVPTCCESGYLQYLCSCGEMQESVLPADPEKHVYEVTGENAGYTLVSCTVCGNSAQQPKTDDIYVLINAQREMNGLDPISVYTEAQPAAELRVQEIKQLFSHLRPDMSSCFSVTQELGIPGFFASENIGRGYVDNAAMVEGWMNSPGHRANLLDDSINAMTVARSGGHWVFMGFIN